MGSNYWHAQPQHNYRNIFPSSDVPVSGGAYDSDPLQNTHRLLTTYPLASATPAAHGIYILGFVNTSDSHIISSY